MAPDRKRSTIMTSTRSGVKTESITAKSGAEFLIEKLKRYNISIVHTAWIQSVCEAIEENAKRQ